MGDMLNMGPPQGRFRVDFQKQNGEIVETEVDARNMADAAWRVARSTFDCMSPGDWQLLDIVTLR
jgi:hypothetical protein